MGTGTGPTGAQQVLRARPDPARRVGAARQAAARGSGGCDEAPARAARGARRRARLGGRAARLRLRARHLRQGDARHPALRVRLGRVGRARRSRSSASPSLWSRPRLERRAASGRSLRLPRSLDGAVRRHRHRDLRRSPSTPGWPASRTTRCTTCCPSCSTSTSGSGSPLLSVLLGDVFRAFNPWRALARASARRAGRAGVRFEAPLAYPARLGRWPAALGILVFAAIELVFAADVHPRGLAVLALVYAVAQLLGMASSASSAGRLAPTRSACTSGSSPGSRRCTGSARGCAVRTPALRPDRADRDPGDGRAGVRDDRDDVVRRPRADVDAGAARSPTRHRSGRLARPGAHGGDHLRRSTARHLRDAQRSAASGTSGYLAARFAHSLVPIALAYVVAHYFSLLATSGQALGYLISDPLGNGSDLFGTAGWTVDLGVISTTAVWLVQVGALDRRPRQRPGLRPRPRAGDVRGQGRRAVPVLDAGRDGRLHLPRTLAALGMMILAHLTAGATAAFVAPTIIVIVVLARRSGDQGARAVARRRRAIARRATVREYWTLERRGERWVVVDARQDDRPGPRRARPGAVGGDARRQRQRQGQAPRGARCHRRDGPGPPARLTPLHFV